jgi:hypothetical protein
MLLHRVMQLRVMQHSHNNRHMVTIIRIQTTTSLDTSGLDTSSLVTHSPACKDITEVQASADPGTIVVRVSVAHGTTAGQASVDPGTIVAQVSVDRGIIIDQVLVLSVTAAAGAGNPDNTPGTSISGFINTLAYWQNSSNANNIFAL